MDPLIMNYLEKHPMNHDCDRHHRNLIVGNLCKILSGPIGGHRSLPSALDRAAHVAGGSV